MPDHIYTIYRITCLVNNKLYTGFTSKEIHKRWKEHQNDTKYGSNCLIHKAIRKYTVENFLVITLYQSWDLDHCKNIMEEYFIRKSKSHVSEGGYNLTFGGEGSIGYKHTKEAKEKISLAGMGRIPNQETRSKISATNKGKSKTPEHCQKISKTKKGKTFPERSEEIKSKFRKTYKIILPNGKIEIVTHLHNFCKENNLIYSNLMDVASGKRKHHRGFKMSRI